LRLALNVPLTLALSRPGAAVAAPAFLIWNSFDKGAAAWRRRKRHWGRSICDYRPAVVSACHSAAWTSALPGISG
jgi:hypothetical protein